jgi:ankyrin repeat protein
LAVVRYLVEQGADKDKRTKGATPLQIAQIAGHTQVAAYLLAAGCT